MSTEVGPHVLVASEVCHEVQPVVHEPQGVSEVASEDAQCISRYWLQVDMSQIYASEWHQTIVENKEVGL